MPEPKWVGFAFAVMGVLLLMSPMFVEYKSPRTIFSCLVLGFFTLLLGGFTVAHYAQEAIWR